MPVCPVCSGPLARGATTCSRDCRGKWVAANRRPRTPRLRPCAKCGVPVLGHRPGLCEDCRAPERVCASCGVAFRADSRRALFCSHSCASRSNGSHPRPHGPDSPTYKGVNRPYATYEWFQSRDAARERDGWRCQDCGRTRPAVRLHAHHLIARVDWGDRPGHPDDIANLVTVCTGCHVKRHALPPEVLLERRRDRSRAYYVAHREAMIARATEYQKGYRARKRAMA